jgi:predicted N-acetyltransferase YhbS
MSDEREQLVNVSDTQIVRADSGERATCALWWRDPPALGAHRVGRIGRYEASDLRAGRKTLERACQQLAQQGCTIAIGPMDGNTWHRYRLITERGSEPPFFLEPDNPDEWPDHFRAAGFRSLAHYSSALDLGLEIRDLQAPAIEQALGAKGVTIRMLDMTAFEREIRAIHRVSLESFTRNLFYSPIGEEEFVAMYLPLRERVDPSLVFIAQHAGEVVGFVFGLPDWLRVQRGQPRDTMIVKTLARRPTADYGGLGAVLLERCRRAARESGYTRCIHALMYDENVSVGLSERFGETMRGYTLFAKDLAPA